MHKTLELHLPELECAGCVPAIENTVNALEKLKIYGVRVEVAAGKLIVYIDKSIPDTDAADIIIAALDDEVGTLCKRYPVDPLKISLQANKTLSLFSAKHEPASSTVVTQPNSGFKKRVIKGIVGVGFGLAFLAVSIACPALPWFAVLGMTIASTALSLYLGKESFTIAFRKLFKGRTVEMHTLFSISAITSIGISLASLFIPGLPSMLDSALLIFGFRHIGVAIEKTVNKEVTADVSFQNSVSKKVWRIRADDQEECHISEIEPGDIIRIYANQKIPLDGECLSAASVYTTIVTGKTLPEIMNHGDNLQAGMQLAQETSYIDLKVSRNEQDSYLARLDNEISRAQLQKAPLETNARKILKYFIPAMLTFAAGAGVVLGLVFNPALAFQCAASLIVSACPCTLGSIIPLAMSVAMTKAAKLHAYFKSGKAMQAAGETDIVIFDLNGTLTEGKYRVSKLEITDASLDKAKMLACLYRIQKKSSHPIAKTIRRYLKNINGEKLSSEDVFKRSAQTYQSGMKAELNGDKYAVGNQSMMKDCGCDLTAYEHLLKNNSAEHIIFFSRNNKVIAYIILQDPLRKNACYVVDELKAMGKQVHICTGTDKSTAVSYANLLGIPASHVHADRVPVADPNGSHKQTKSALIEAFQVQGKKVAMIGDADNDAMPFKTSDVSILVKSNATKDQQADVTIEKRSLLPVLAAFKIGKEAVSNINTNLYMTLGYNVATLSLIMGLTIGLGFVLNPGIGVALMIIQASLVMYTVYRFKNSKISTEYAAKIIAEDNENQITPPVLNNITLHKTMQSSVTIQKTPEVKTTHTKQIVPYPVCVLEAKQNIADPMVNRPILAM